MKKLLIVLLAIGLMVCVGCGKKEQEVQLPQQKAPVGKEVPVAPNMHKQQDNHETEKPKKPVVMMTEDEKITNKIIYGNEEGKSNLKETKPIRSTGFK